MEPGSVVLLALGAFAFFIVLLTVLGSFFTIETAHAGVVQRLGKFSRVAAPGLNFKTPFYRDTGQHDFAPSAAVGCKG
jgi:regulator of protease activity HflC (stomatin/prohibitin superfamily)